MKRICEGAGYLVIGAVAGACATSRPALAGGESRFATPSLSSVSRQRLADAPLMSAYDALQLMPAYARRINETPIPRFVLHLDGGFSTDIQILKSIPSPDVREMRVIGENRSLAGGNAIELVVNTIAGARVP